MKRLVRKKHDLKVTGLSAGIADYLKADVAIVRLAIIVLIILTGVVLGLLAYLIAAAIIPKEGD